jgi:hypothetical protein
MQKGSAIPGWRRAESKNSGLEPDKFFGLVHFVFGFGTSIPASLQGEMRADEVENGASTSRS